MALADVAATLKGDLPHKTCGACHALTNMSEQDAAQLRALLADRAVKFTALAAALREDAESPNIDPSVLSRHARGGCSAREFLR